jgi:hypothetical protein
MQTLSFSDSQRVMPKTDQGQSDKSRPEDDRKSSDEVDGRYPTSAEREESIERAREVKQKHDNLFRRLAGKDDE